MYVLYKSVRDLVCTGMVFKDKYTFTNGLSDEELGPPTVIWVFSIHP